MRKITVALIPAAGRGARFGAAENKIFTPLLGRPLLGWTLEAFARCKAIDAIVLVGAEGELDRLTEIGEQFSGGKLLGVVAGGSTRQESVKLGLDALPESCEIVAIHDAARCCATPRLVETVVESARFWKAATASLAVRDTLVYEDAEGVTGYPRVGQPADRDELRIVQTPQVFPLETLRTAHAQALAEDFVATDDASLYARFLGTVALAEGSGENIKVTTPEDLVMVESILSRRIAESVRTGEEAAMNNKESIVSNEEAPSRFGGQGGHFRIGHGYDVHRLVAGRAMWLGGVHFEESELGLDGHSDADAPLHALCDALLGAAGLPDIGQLFPPSDQAHKDRASMEFVRDVKQRLDADGWSVENVDLTIIAEAPKIGPRASEMKAIISQALGVAPEQVSIKATTNEGLGFVGRGEGIAAHASALISRSSR